MKKIYLAGLDISLPAPKIQPLIDGYKDICTKYDCEALFPTTTAEQLKIQGIESFDTPLEEAQTIFRANLQRIDSASAIVANLDYCDNFYLNDTIFEIGYAYSRGKQIIGYVNHEYQMIYHALRTGGRISEYSVGYFGRPSNLMVACAVTPTIQGCFEDCLDYLYNPKHEEDCRLYTINHRA